MKKIILLTAVTALLSSCGIYTKYQPETTTPDSLYGDVIMTTDTTTLGNVDWHDLFTDPYLRDLIEKGLAKNTNMQTAALRVEEAKAALLSAKLAYLPSLAFTPSGTVSSWNHQKATQTYSIPVTASWELDIFGKMRNAQKQAQAVYAQTVDYKQAVRTQVISGIANVYYTLLMLDEQLQIAEATADSWKEVVASSRALMDAGLSNEAAISQMEAAYYSVENSVVSLREQLNQTENALSLILAETPRFHKRGFLKNQQFPEDLAVGVPLQMLSNRPDVRAAERQLEAAFYATNAARSRFYPSITLSGSAGWTNNAGMIVNPGKLLASAVASMTQPLFAKGQLITNLKISKAQQEEASLSFQQALLNAGAEVNNALTACQTSREKRKLFEKQVTSLEKAVESTSLLMEYGTKTYLEVLTARQSLLSAQLSQTANRFTEIQSVISLYEALGGGRE